MAVLPPRYCWRGSAAVLLARLRRGRSSPIGSTALEPCTIELTRGGLLESGLVVSATCTDCHTTHGALPSSDPASSVHPQRIAGTCGRCHHGIEATFEANLRDMASKAADYTRYPSYA